MLVVLMLNVSCGDSLYDTLGSDVTCGSVVVVASVIYAGPSMGEISSGATGVSALCSDHGAVTPPSSLGPSSAWLRTRYVVGPGGWAESCCHHSKWPSWTTLSHRSASTTATAVTLVNWDSGAFSTVVNVVSA